MIRLVLQVGLAMLVSACAAKKPLELADPFFGDVAVTKLPPTEETYQAAAPDEAYDYPRQFGDNAPPAYPDELLAQRMPPQRVPVRVIVDAAGIVTSISPLDAGAPLDPAFLTAIRTAVSAWKFTPLVHIKNGPGRTDITFQDVVSTYTGLATALPFHQDYEFWFTQRDGKGFVSTQAPGKPQ
jgi:hypothetical protein